jgi:hypothetical protein
MNRRTSEVFHAEKKNARPTSTAGKMINNLGSRVRHSSGCHRAGLSLIEVLVATAILMASTALLLDLAQVGQKHASSAEDKAVAHRICHSLLNEMLVGARPLESVPLEPLPDEPGWNWSVEVTPLEARLTDPQIAVVRVTVSKEPLPNRRGEEFSLWQWVRVRAQQRAPEEAIP